MRDEPGIAPEAQQPERYKSGRSQDREQRYGSGPVCLADVVEGRASSQSDCSGGGDDHQPGAGGQAAGNRSGHAGVEALDGMHAGQYGRGHTSWQAADRTLQPRDDVLEEVLRLSA